VNYTIGHGVFVIIQGSDEFKLVASQTDSYGKDKKIQEGKYEMLKMNYARSVLQFIRTIIRRTFSFWKSNKRHLNKNITHGQFQ
jgi:hypothetical protein